VLEPNLLFLFQMQSRAANFFFLVLLSCLFITPNLSAQITATPQQGCAPLVGVQFTGVTGATGILWNFGDGTFANSNNPVHTFSLVGNYNVTYTATVSGSPVSQTILVKVFGKPTPNFTMSAPTNGCVPLAVTFTDHSTGGGGAAITAWQWNFGDGGVSTTQNPNYSYSIGGQFDVTLIATDANGCDSAITLTDVITVSPKPTVIISSTPASLSSCSVPFTVTYNGSSCATNSPIGGGLTYAWDFGNSTTSTSVTPPAVTYNAQGTYTVSLTCTDNNNCSQTATRTVTIVQPQVKAVVIDSLCLGALLTIRDTSFANQTIWNFGDGTGPQTLLLPNTPGITHLYAAAGTYTITATSSIGACTDVKTYVIVIDEVIAEFSTAGPHFTCNPDLTVNYTNLSSPNSAYYVWEFSDNMPNSSQTNPIINYNQNSLHPYTIYQQLPLTTTLTAVSALGCWDTAVRTLDSIHRPTAFFYTDGNEGCAPLTIIFTDSSFSGAAITNYEWHFDDGSPVVSGPDDTLVTHTYTNVGVYNPYLVIHNADGCLDTSFLYPITAVDPPDPEFTFSPTTVCPKDTVFITNNTNPADSVNHWHVISDATYFSGCINDPNPAWNFTHTGVHNITLVGYTHSCRNDTTVPLQITVKGPIATGRYHTQCGDSAYKVMFEAYLQDAESATWNYGDGQTETVTGNGLHTTFHTYAASGNYDAYLTGVNSMTGCTPYVDSVEVVVRKIHAAFTNLPNVCSGLNTTYNASASIDVMANCGIGYSWYFTNIASGTPVSIPPFVTPGPTLTEALPPGIYTIMMWVKDENECHDTTEGIIRVSGIDADFSLNDTTGCLPAFNMTTNQLSTSDTTITSYSWTFGDGSGTFTGPNPAHTYTAATSPTQSYTVNLTATNILGCIDTSRIVITVSAPHPTIATTSQIFICAGKTVSFSSGGVPGANNYAWNFGDGTAVQSTPTGTVTHTFTPGGTYTVNVLVSDPANCQGQSNNVTVYVQDYPIAAFDYQNLTDSSSDAACSGSSMIFIDESVNPFPGPRQWNLGTGGGIVGSDTVGTSYTCQGTCPIPVHLIVSSTYGCRDTIRDTIYVYGASANFSIDRPTICKGESIIFDTLNPQNVFTWHWDFGDGTDANDVAPVSHQYNFHPPGGSTNVTLVYWTQDSTCRYSTVQPINIREVIADFDRNNEINFPVDTAHCIGSTDLFNNTSLNATSYSWNFGDGNTSSATSPSHTYAVADTFIVTLAISDVQFGCKDTIRREMIIYPIPSALANGDSSCLGSPAQLGVTGDPGLTYVWEPASVLNNNTLANPQATITETTTFTVTAYANYSGGIACSTVVNTTIYVQQPPLHIDWDTTIIIGQNVPLPGNAGLGMNYLWLPPTTDLSCTTCPNPTSSSLVNITYLVAVSDDMGCFSDTNSFTIEVMPKSTVDVPTAFTPDGDGVNDIIYVDGWGIKDLIYFRIYNRWGQLLFESTDLKTGWDGYYKGVLQNMETYVYQVSAQTYTDAEPRDIKGYFKLIR
jgi:gliding motility-associated-like protein